MTIGIGILGFAHAHVGMYCSEWAKAVNGPVKVVAGWDHDAARVEGKGKELGFAPSPTPAALLADKAVQAVVIGSETSMHTGLVVAAAEAGKAIILQKPIALTLAQADTIVDVVKRTGVPFTMAWQMRTDPQNIEMKRLVHDGTLGRVYMVRRRHTLATHLWAGFENSWHVKPELNRGMWADDAAHAIDFLLWLLGEPQTVMAEIATLRRPEVPDDNGIAIFRYADGTFAEVVGSFVCIGGENTTEIVGEKGVVVQNYGDATSAGAPRPQGAVGLKWLLQGANAWTNSEIASPPNHGYRIGGLCTPLAEFLEGKRPTIGTAEEGRTALKMTLATYESAKTGCRVKLADIR